MVCTWQLVNEESDGVNSLKYFFFRCYKNKIASNDVYGELCSNGRQGEEPTDWVRGREKERQRVIKEI